MIVPSLARMLIREHLYNPIRGKVLTLGRQTIALTYGELLELFEQESFSPPEKYVKELTISHDENTRVGKGTSFISDEVFFNLLGVEEVFIMDVSEYEGASIIHDLNNAIPESLEGQFDFIIDGGTFDHLVNLRTAFDNVFKMLKIGGRVFQWNAASNFVGAAYISFSPDFFYDYYIVNQFSDCKVYLAEVDHFSQRELWDLYEFEGLDRYDHFKSNRVLMTIVLAEKGSSSTYESIPVQSQYRDEHLWQAYRNSQKTIATSNRKTLSGSRKGRKLSKSNSTSMSSVNKLILKLREQGFMWVLKFGCRKAVNRLLVRKRPQSVRGYKYIGRI